MSIFLPVDNSMKETNLDDCLRILLSFLSCPRPTACSNRCHLICNFAFLLDLFGRSLSRCGRSLVTDIREFVSLWRPDSILFPDSASGSDIAGRAILQRHGKNIASRCDQGSFACGGKFSSLYVALASFHAGRV